MLTNPDGTAGPAAPGMLTVVPAGSLGVHSAAAAAAASAVRHDPSVFGRVRMSTKKSRS